MKQWAKFLILTPIATPIVAVISCSNETGAPNSNIPLFEKSTLDHANVKRLFISQNILKKDLAKLPASLNGTYHSKIIVGGYQEPRNIYNGNFEAKTPRISYHAGNDILVDAGTKVLAPFDGDILGAGSAINTKQITASGVGGEVMMRVKIANLDISQELREFIYIKSKYHGKTRVDKFPKLLFAIEGKYVAPKLKSTKSIVNKTAYEDFITKNKVTKIEQERSEYIYLYFLHLSQQSILDLDQKSMHGTFDYKGATYKIALDTFDINHFKHVKKGDVIGVVADTAQNGGWQPHVHVEAYVYPQARPEQRYYHRNYLSPSTLTISTYRRAFAAFKGVGTYAGTLSNPQADKQKWAKNYGSINTNEIFHLYDAKTPIIRIS